MIEVDINSIDARNIKWICQSELLLKKGTRVIILDDLIFAKDFWFTDSGLRLIIPNDTICYVTKVYSEENIQYVNLITQQNIKLNKIPVTLIDTVDDVDEKIENKSINPNDENKNKMDAE